MATSQDRERAGRKVEGKGSPDAKAVGPAARPVDARAQRRAKAAVRRTSRTADGEDPHAAGPLGAPIEFEAEHNPQFARLGVLMAATGAVTVLVALLGVVTLLLAGLTATSAGWLVLLTLLPPVAAAAVGIWTLRAGQRFGLIASTEGSDVGHLMLAIRELNKVYILQLVAFGLGVAALVAVLVLSLMLGRG